MATGNTAGRFGIVGSVVLQGAQQVQAQLQNIRQLTTNTAKEFNQAQLQAARFSAATTQLLKQPASSLIFLGLDLQQLAQSLAVLSGGFAIAGAASTKFAIDFQAQLRSINALAQLSEEQLARLGGQLRDLSSDPTIIQGPIELAQGLKFIISSGFQGAEALAVLRNAADGATLGNADLATVSKALVGVLNALPKGTISANDALDILAETVDKGIIEFEDLSSQLGEVLGAVGATQVPFTEVGAAIATITRAGVPAAETMTSLNRVLLSFISPTAEAKELAASLGLEFNIASLRSKGLVQSLREVDDAVGDDTEALNKLFGDVRAVRGVFALTRNDLRDFTELAEQQTLATQGLGAASRQLGEQLKSPSNQIKNLLGDLQNSAITIGNDFLPVVALTVQGLAGLARGFRELDPVFRFAIEGVGLTAIALTGFLFVVARSITGLGALKNFYQRTFAQLGTSTGIIGTNTGMLAANTIATGANSAAQYQSAIARGRASQATIANTGVLSANTTTLIANKAAGLGVLGWIGRLSAIAGVGLVVFEITQALKGLSLELLTATENTRQLLDTAKILDQIRPSFGGAPLGIGAVLSLAVPTGNEIREQISKPTLEVELAFNQAKDAQDEFIEGGIRGLGKLEKQLRQIIETSNDPQLIANAVQALEEIRERGVQAVSKTGFSTLTRGQKALVRDFLSQLDRDITAAEKAKEVELVVRLKANKEQFLRDIGGLVEREPITLDVVLDPFIKEKEAEIAAEALKAEKAVAALNAQLKVLERQQRANRIAQLELSIALDKSTREFDDALRSLEAQERTNKAAQSELNVVLRQAQRELRGAQDAVDSLKDALSDANDRIQKFSNPSLVGMRALEDAIFGISQRIAQLNLELLGIQSAFLPGISQAEEDVLRLRLALLEAGDEAEDMGKKAQFGIDDLIDAQQRELREGVPVLRTIWEKIQDAATGKSPGTTTSPEQEALNTAEKRLEILRLQQQLAEIQLRRELELESIEQRRLELTKEITFEPQLRQLRLMADQTKEITFEEAVRELQQAISDQNRFNAELLTANRTLKDRETTVDDLQAQSDELQAAAEGIRLEEQRINDIIAERKQFYEDLLKPLQDQAALLQLNELKLQQQKEDLAGASEANLKPLQKELDLLKQMADLRAQATGGLNQGEDNTARDAASRTLDELGLTIADVTRKQAEATTRVQELINQGVSGIGLLPSIVEQAVGAIGGATSRFANFFLGLFERSRTASFGEGPSEADAFHHGGEVAPALPRGTEVPALLQAGEHVLTHRQASEIKKIGISLTPFKLPKFHEGGEVKPNTLVSPAVPKFESAMRESRIQTNRIESNNRELNNKAVTNTNQIVNNRTNREVNNNSILQRNNNKELNSKTTFQGISDKDRNNQESMLLRINRATNDSQETMLERINLRELNNQGNMLHRVGRMQQDSILRGLGRTQESLVERIPIRPIVQVRAGPVQIIQPASQTWNWQVHMNNYGSKSPDIMGRLVREVKMRRIAGNWR